MFERFTDQARHVVVVAQQESATLGHDHIGTEHLLLGVLRAAEADPRGEFAAATLPGLGLDPATARDRVLAEVTDAQRRDPPGG